MTFLYTFNRKKEVINYTLTYVVRRSCFSFGWIKVRKTDGPNRQKE